VSGESLPRVLGRLDEFLQCLIRFTRLKDCGECCNRLQLSFPSSLQAARGQQHLLLQHCSTACNLINGGSSVSMSPAVKQMRHATHQVHADNIYPGPRLHPSELTAPAKARPEAAVDCVIRVTSTYLCGLLRLVCSLEATSRPWIVCKWGGPVAAAE
jgi:hypothetical protein